MAQSLLLVNRCPTWKIQHTITKNWTRGIVSSTSPHLYSYLYLHNFIGLLRGDNKSIHITIALLQWRTMSNTHNQQLGMPAMCRSLNVVNCGQSTRLQYYKGTDFNEHFLYINIYIYINVKKQWWLRALPILIFLNVGTFQQTMLMTLRLRSDVWVVRVRVTPRRNGECKVDVVYQKCKSLDSGQ